MFAHSSFRSSSPATSESSSSSSSSSLNMLYVPMHKRSESRGSSTMTTPISGSFTDLSLKAFEGAHRPKSPSTPRIPIYSLDELLAIRHHSPLIRDAIDKDVLRAVFEQLPMIFQPEGARGRSPRRRHNPKKVSPIPTATATPSAANAFPHAFTRQRIGRVRPGRQPRRQPAAMHFASDEPTWRHTGPLTPLST